MHKLISYNGTIFSAASVSINPTNAGLLHGCGVFTTLRVYRYQPFQFEEHWQRLQRQALVIGLTLSWSSQVVLDSLRALIKANKVAEGKVRITLLERKSQFWRLNTVTTGTDLVIFTAPIQPRDSEIALTISPYRLNSTSPLVGLKVLDYLQQIMTLKEAENRQFDDALVLNERGEICETATANIFWVRAGILYTPILSTGCLPGITRQLVLKLSQHLHIQVSEGAFYTDHILNADDAFTTSSVRELVRVSNINSRQLPASANSIFERLLRAYKNYVEANLGTATTGYIQNRV